MSAVREFLGSATIADRVRALAADIRRDAGDGTPVHLVCVLKGAFIFLADLMRAMDGPVTCDFIVARSYVGTTTTGQVELVKDLGHPIEGRHVVIVEDIVDTGLTLAHLQAVFATRKPAALRTACLLSKPSRRKVDVPVEFIGFTIEDRFVVGYGLDYDEAHRGLPFIGILGED